MSTNTRLTLPETAAAELARALLILEPMKVEGGSPERQAWLGQVLDTQMYLLGQDRRLAEHFMEAMLA